MIPVVHRNISTCSSTDNYFVPNIVTSDPSELIILIEYSRPLEPGRAKMTPSPPTPYRLRGEKTVTNNAKNIKVSALLFCTEYFFYALNNVDMVQP